MSKKQKRLITEFTEKILFKISVRSVVSVVNSLIVVSVLILTQACSMQVKPEATATPTAQKAALPTPTRMPPTPTATQISATATRLIPSAMPAPNVTISAVNGDLFIRRGPDMAYNPIGVLYKGTTVNAVRRDVLSKWVQIVIPNSKQTGWVSILTEYSKVEGNVSALPEFHVTDWPIAGYVRNCTKHQMLLLPGDIFIDTADSKPENMVWVYPGFYKVYDIDMVGLPKPPQVDAIEVREGLTVDIRYDGTGEKRKCP